MTTAKQILGQFGEEVVRKQCNCPDCDNCRFKPLGNNFKCADIICEFCGFLGQVKAKNVKDIETIPKTILGAAWKPQEERMKKGFFFPLFVVLVKDFEADTTKHSEKSIWYLSKNTQKLHKKEIFLPRKPLSKTARRAGWQGFYYNLEQIKLERLQ